MNTNSNNPNMATQNIPTATLTTTMGSSVRRDPNMGHHPALRSSIALGSQTQSRGRTSRMTTIGGVQVELSQSRHAEILVHKLVVVDFDGIPSYRLTNADGWMVAVQPLGNGEAEVADKINAALSAAREGYTT